MGLFYNCSPKICCHDLTFIMMKQESMPAAKSEVTIYFVFLGKSLNVAIFRLVWTCLFSVDIQSNSELGLVMMEKTA